MLWKENFQNRRPCILIFPEEFWYPIVIIKCPLLKIVLVWTIYIVTLVKKGQEQKSEKKIQKYLLKALLGLWCLQDLPHPNYSCRALP